jgi:copper chaperone CopZ
MTCAHCVRAVFTSLAAVEGVTRAQVSLGAAEIEHDGRATIDGLREAIAVAGYSVIEGREERRALTVLENG